jgi:choline kinase
MSGTIIILAAGSGTRLMPLTADRPKVMVPFKGRPILEWQIQAARESGASRIVVVAGYHEESVVSPEVVKVLNPKFATTNMVESLWCAQEYFGQQGFAVSYGDIVYEPGVLAELWRAPHASSVIVDLEWKGYWERRFTDVLADAESLQMTPERRLSSIGQRETSVDRIQAQYIGLFKLGPEAVLAAATIRQQARPLGHVVPGWTPPPRAIEMWHMTDLLHALIHSGIALQAVPISGRWVEIDSQQDLAVADALTVVQDGRLRIRA